jgi:hypothetical protein
VIALPPLDPRVHLTVADLPAFADALPIVGIAGALGSVALTGVEAVPSETRLTARMETE